MEIPFSSSPRASLGIEWELELVDRDSRQLRSGASQVLAALAPAEGVEHPKAKRELFESCVEVITGVCSTVGEAEQDLARTLAEVTAQADRLGLGVMCSGSHPITNWTTQEISPAERYQNLVTRMQWLARRMQIFGVHVHVGVRSPQKVIPIVNALTAYVPHFLALSASSPYWIGEDTGLASVRSKVFESLPTAGLPYQLSGWAEFETFMATLISAGTIESVKDVWWDIRPHPDYGTVEFRVCDGLPTLWEVGMVAALAHCLVQRLDSQLDQGYTLPRPTSWVLRENKWRATRHGLDCEVILDDGGATRPLRDLLRELVEELAPTAKRLGCTEQLNRVLPLLELGASYERQRGVAAAHNGELGPVVDSLLAEMKAGVPAGLEVLGGAA